LRFDRFTLDPTRGCLRESDRDIGLRPKTFEVLCYLTENAGRLLSKQELFEAVWPNISVCNDSLVQCICELRQKLRDEHRRLIKTMSRCSYLLGATVLVEVPQSLPDGCDTLRRTREARNKTILPRDPLRTISDYKLRIWHGWRGPVGIKLNFIPSYCPPGFAKNLTPDRELWGLVHRKITQKNSTQLVRNSPTRRCTA
jgi:DNA-binding winged helix-turn-helix (wHTH) protein